MEILNHMKIKNTIYASFALVTYCLMLTSCRKNATARFEITNNTTSIIDSLIILPNKNSGQFISVDPNTTVNYSCDMNGGTKVDGEYQLTYKIDSKIKINHFGYYTNGDPTEKLIKVNIEADTVKLESVF
jgi:hypothetical protein